MNEPNIYASPSTEVCLNKEEERKPETILQDLKSQSTWRLFFLTIITLGIYSAHYLRRQTNILNKHLGHNQQISSILVTFVLIVTYISAILVIPYSLLAEGHIIDDISGVIDIVFYICTLVWVFKVRNRINTILQTKSFNRNWFHGIWTFLFHELYINYQINKLNE